MRKCDFVIPIWCALALQVFYAHRLVLAAYSPHFANLLYKYTTPKPGLFSHFKKHLVYEYTQLDELIMEHTVCLKNNLKLFESWHDRNSSSVAHVESGLCEGRYSCSSSGLHVQGVLASQWSRSSPTSQRCTNVEVWRLSFDTYFLKLVYFNKLWTGTRILILY